MSQNPVSKTIAIHRLLAICGIPYLLPVLKAAEYLLGENSSFFRLCFAFATAVFFCSGTQGSNNSLAYIASYCMPAVGLFRNDLQKPDAQSVPGWQRISLQLQGCPCPCGCLFILYGVELPMASQNQTFPSNVQLQAPC